MEKALTEKKTSAVFFLKCLLFSYILTLALLLLLAFLLYRLGLTEKVVSVAIIAIYVGANFLGGFMAGRKMQNRRFMWGLLLGSVYFLVLVLLSLVVNHSLGNFADSFLTTYALCAGGGMLGGMLS